MNKEAGILTAPANSLFFNHESWQPQDQGDRKQRRDRKKQVLDIN